MLLGVVHGIWEYVHGIAFGNSVAEGKVYFQESVKA